MLIVVLLEEWGEEERKKNYPLVIDGQEELNPMEKPNPMEESNRALDGEFGPRKSSSRTLIKGPMVWRQNCAT
jgi:hypothetical protein